MRVIASHYLRDNINSFDNCGPKTANALAELNCRLLEDNNPWVQQEAFESFDCMAHMCPNEDLVTKMATAITKKPSLNDSVPAYLSSTIHYELRDFSDVRLYLQYLAKHSQNVRHVCYHYEESERNEKFARLDTELSGSNSVEIQSSGELNERVNKICDELNDISKKTADVSEHSLRRLRSLCVKMLDLTDPLKET